jgi:glycosyltransferase involved in cell wall biosynthesis/small nuclear ribonucleoprotein (snRNP)-like protein
VTTFIDFRYSRALAAALFAGQEKEETRIEFDLSGDNFLVLSVRPEHDGLIATIGDSQHPALSIVSESAVLSVLDAGRNPIVSVQLKHNADNLVGIRISTDFVGLRLDDFVSEASWKAPAGVFALDIQTTSVRVMGQGTGRVARWGELFYKRNRPNGLCVQLTMDWHHLRAGIPLFGTMTAENLIEQGRFLLRFSSYAYESSDAETTDFVKLFGSDDGPDIAVHLTPALYNPRVPGIPNLAFAVIESTSVHPHLVERCNAMDEILVPTSFTADAFRESGVTRPIHVVSHGVDTSYFRPPSARTPLPGGSGFNFLAVATHVERKNIRHLVKAFLEEFRSADDVALFLLLRPEYHTSQNNVALEFTDWEREYANENSAPIYLWTGYLTRDHLRDFYANADCYVMPSNEGFGLTVLEAMACETPVIALDHGGVTDFVNGHNGTLVARGREYVASDIDTLPYVGDRFYEPDQDELKRAMRQVYTHRRQARDKARRARADCETRLTWEAVTTEFSRRIEETHSRYHGNASTADRVTPIELTLVLCVMDDESAARSLDYLAKLSHKSIRVLCLFTRYARIDDVLRARKYGFAYYRWNGTLDNALVIARSIVGRTWIAVLNNGEKLSGELSSMTEFLNAQPETVTTVTIDGEPRFFHLRPESERGSSVSYSGLSIG